MRDCNEIAAVLHSYVDGELAPSEILALEAHLMDCPACRDRFEAVLSVVGPVRAAHPLYPAPESSFGKARAQIESHRRRRMAWTAGVAAAVLIAGFAVWFQISNQLSTHTAFSGFAAETHTRYVQGALPLDIRSGDPKTVENWLSQRLPFHVSLPAYPEFDATEPYLLLGARLLDYKEEPAAYLAYAVNGRPVSLLITSSENNRPSGGTAQEIGRLRFYSASHRGLSSVSWIDKGLSYSLVSDQNTVGAESCVVCHGTAADRPKFAPLLPRS